MNNYKSQVKVIYDVVSKHWEELDKLTKVDDNDYIRTLGQDRCQNEYYSICNAISFNQTGIELSLYGNPKDSREINRLSYQELISMFKTTNLDFYMTAKNFRKEKMTSCKDKLEYWSEAKAYVLDFAPTINCQLDKPSKSKVYSKKAVQEYVQYEEAELKAFEAELKTKGLLSLGNPNDSNDPLNR
tara:strand:- start:154 stop:711 length:558 start_codon:yes stop_codon:yes gene_type:complete